MTKLSTESIRQFQRRSQSIERNTLLPILSNLKLEVSNGLATLTKNSLNAVCIGQVVHEGESTVLLLDERILFQLAAVTKSEWIEITQHEGRILLKEQEETFLPLEDPANFPLAPEISEQDGFKLEQQHIAAINIARNYINNSETAGPFQFVHLEGENIFAFHNNFFYINGGFKDLPSVSLRPEETAMIIEHATLEFLDLPRHHVFFSPGYTFIYTKGELSGIPKLNTVFDRLKLPGADVSFSKEEYHELLHSEAKEILQAPMVDPVSFAWAFWVQTQMSFSFRLFGGYAFSNNGEANNTRNKREGFKPVIYNRIKKVEIFHRDAIDLIQLKDGPDTFMYLDPPYPESDCGHYEKGKNVYYDLLELLPFLKCKWLLSSYPSEQLTALRLKMGYNSKNIEQALSVSGKHNAGKVKTECLTWNYNLAQQTTNQFFIPTEDENSICSPPD